MLFRFMERLDQPQLARNPDHRWLYDSVDIRFLALSQLRVLPHLSFASSNASVPLQ